MMWPFKSNELQAGKLDADDIYELLTQDITPFQFTKHMKRFRNNDNFPERVSFKRQKGRTTRLADEYIQKLFKNGAIKIRDHHDTLDSHKRLFDIIYKRLKMEHRHTLDDLHINKHQLTISFEDYTPRL